MIAFLHGRLKAKEEDSVVVDVQGVGYQVIITKQTRTELPELGAELFLHTALEVREDSMTLYGFSNLDESNMFRMLRNVSGIGPKTALNILSGAQPGELRQAILFEDIGRLSKLPGIGKKTAQRLVLELKDKMKIRDHMSATLTGSISAEEYPLQHDSLGQAGEALSELGYSTAEIEAAFQKLAQLGHLERTEDKTVESIIKLSLQLLARDQIDGGTRA